MLKFYLMVSRYILLVIFIVSSLSRGVVASESEDVKIVTSRVDNISRVQENAARWGISTEQWKTYEELMRGEARYMLPDVDPLTVLGTYAKTDAERRLYGERIARMEYEFTQRFLALKNSYHAAFDRLYGNEPMLSLNDFYSRYSSIENDEARPSSQFGDRYILFINSNCGKCNDLYKKIQSRQGVGSTIDIYFIGDEKKQIINWGKKMGIKPEHVTSQLVTLNQDNGQYAKYSRPSLPAVFYFDSKSGNVEPFIPQ